MASLKNWIIAIAGAAALTGVGIGIYHRIVHRGEIKSLTGVVLVDAADPGKQFPLENVRITVPLEGRYQPAGTTTTDSSGRFRLTLHGVHAMDPITLELRRAGFRPADVEQSAANKLYVLRMTSLTAPENKERVSTGPATTLSNLRVRYSMKSQMTVNVGSAVKVFNAVNIGDTPCDRTKGPCSPDGKWKAALGSASLDAGEGNEFQDARVSCIAGPCPFATIVTDNFSRGGQTISATAETWSDTVTFLMEAEVTRLMVTDSILQSFPAISGPSMDFTLPPTGQGPSIEAEVNGSEVVFPLGPGLDLTWATCHVKITADRNKLYHCDLKPGFQFKPPGGPETGS